MMQNTNVRLCAPPPPPPIFDYRFFAACGNTKLRVVAFTLTPKISAVQNAFRFPIFSDRNTISLNSHVF